MADLLQPKGFSRDNDSVLRKWGTSADICCAIAPLVFEGGDYATIEIGFISPHILRWVGLSSDKLPLPYYGNGFGIYYRLESLGITKGIVFPPGGWSIVNAANAEAFKRLLVENLFTSVEPLLDDLLTWNGWINHFRRETSLYPRGRAMAWTMLGYSLLADTKSSRDAIEKAIEQHAGQDPSNTFGNRLDLHIARQRELLRDR